VCNQLKANFLTYPFGLWTENVRKVFHVFFKNTGGSSIIENVDYECCEVEALLLDFESVLRPLLPIKF
jgi:hypothetical protein